MNTWQGIGGRGGGLAEYVSVDIQNVHHLPAHVTCKCPTCKINGARALMMPLVEAGATLESLAVAYHAVKRSGYRQGQTALVSGAGPVSELSP